MPRKSNAALAEAMKDPLIAALVGKMPMPKTVWPKAKRTKWLELLSRSFDEIYDDAPPAIGPNGVAIVTETTGPKNYYILPDGMAMADGKWIDAQQIPRGADVLDYRSPPDAGRWDAQEIPIMWLTGGAVTKRVPARLVPTDGPLPSQQNMNGSAEVDA
jgi:hypothetical protein